MEIGNLPSAARTGRENQVYEDGKRQVVACVPVRDGKVLLVSSRTKDEWIVPKGGREADETMEESAKREAWEEAGVVGRIKKYLGNRFVERKSNSVFHFYWLEVTTENNEWPEKESRRRQWFSFEEALDICKREEVMWALEETRHLLSTKQ
eukprot:Nk52_evm39s359 gene=Nk52_evmTU39s359